MGVDGQDSGTEVIRDGEIKQPRGWVTLMDAEVTHGGGRASLCPPHVLPLLVTLTCLSGHRARYGGGREEESW